MVSATTAAAAVDGAQARPAHACSGPDAESGDAVADLVKGNQSARHRGGDGRQFLLGKADGQRQQRRTTQPGQRKRQDAEPRIRFSARTRWRSAPAVTTNGSTRQTHVREPSFDGGKQDAARGDHGPETWSAPATPATRPRQNGPSCRAPPSCHSWFRTRRRAGQKRRTPRIAAGICEVLAGHRQCCTFVQRLSLALIPEQ